MPIPPKLVVASMLQIIGLSVPCLSRVAQRLELFRCQLKSLHYRYIDQVEVGRPRITGMGDPLALQDAATKNYVDSTIGRRNIVFSMDTSDAISDYGIASWLTQVAPPTEYEEGTVARILCTSLSNSASTVNLNTYLGTSTTEFITPLTPGSTTPGGTSFGVNNVSFTAVTVPPPTFSVFRTVKVFQLQSGVWAVPV